MNCRHCGSERIISAGVRTKCKDCGTTSYKIQRRIKIPVEDRPLCPECGNSNPYALGSVDEVREWSCRSCGRRYRDRPTINKVELSTLEVQIE